MKKNSNSAEFDAVAKLLESLVESSGKIDALLGKVAEYYDADRAYIFEIAPGGKTIDNTYEWCREGVTAEIDNLQNIPVEVGEVWFREFDRSGAFHVSSLDEDVAKDSLIHGILEPQGIESLIAAPLYNEGTISGFIGVDNPKKNHEGLAVLKTAASIIYGDIRQNLFEEKESGMVTSVISTMAEDFDYISATNVDTGEITRYRASEKCLNVIRKIDENLSSNERMGIFLKRIIHPDDWESFRSLTSPEKINSELAKSPVYKFDIRTVNSSAGGKVEWYRFKFAYLEGNRHIFVMGILNIDEQVRRDQELAVAEQKAQFEMNREVLENMIDAYQSVYSVSMDDNTFDVIKASEVLKKYFSDQKDFREAFIGYIKMFVDPDDRQMMLDAFKPGYISQKLKEEKTYRMVFRDTFKNTTKWHEMIVQMLSGSGGSGNRLLFGFREDTDGILADKARSTIFGEYVGIYAADLDRDIIHIIKQSPLYRVKTDESEARYSDMIRGFGKFVGIAETEEYFNQISDPEYLRELLTTDAKIEQVYRVNTNLSDTGWNKVSIYAMDRRNGVPETAIFVFDHVDTIQSENIRQRDIIGGVAKEYLSLYYINLISGQASVNSVSAKVSKTTSEVVSAHTDTKSTAVRSVIDDYRKALGEFIDKAVKPEYRPVLDKLVTPEGIRHALKGRQSYTERFVTTSDGRELWEELVLLKSCDPDEETDNVLLGFRDVNDAVMKELSDKKSIEQEMQVISGLASDCVSLYTADLDNNTYKVYSITDEVDDIKSVVEGYSNLPKALRDYADGYVHEDDREKIYYYADLDNMRAALRNARSQKVTVRRNVNGKWVWIEMNMIKVEPVSEPAKNVILAFTDRTTQVEQELEIRQKMDESRQKLEQELKVINGLASDCVSLYTADLDNNTYKVYSITDEVDDIKSVVEGYSNLPKALRDYADGYVHEEDREKIYYYADLDNMRAALRNSRSQKVVVRRNVDGKWVWIEMNMIKVEPVSEPAKNVILAFTNRTEQVEQELEARQQLEDALALAQSANKAKSTFLNNMSHDIRTPMNSIVGYAGLAATHIDDTEQVQTYLGKIMNSSNHLLSLINDVLDMARIESGKMNLTETKESLPEMLHTIHDIVLSDVNAKQLDFFIDTVDIKDEFVICDKTRLNQVLLNILSNAIKYTPTGGTVTMRISETAVSHSGYGTYEFHIKDSGVGMSAEELAGVFEPFERAASADANQIVGTGLGMSIVKNIVDMMGGHIDIASEEGKGTEVTITLEFKLEEVQTEQETIPELRGVRGIVVDDDMNACKSISKMLKTIGMRSDWCTSGKECIFRTEEAVQEGDYYKVYIIDWLMPDMNGIETTRRIRRLVGDNVPIIILTAYDYSDIEDEAREAGVTAFISKPIFQSDLAKTLRGLCATEDAAAAEEEKTYDFAGKKILVVEDNEDNLDIIQQLLTEEGIVISSAVNGKIAVDVMSDAEPGEFDLILMDIRMPVMDGLEAAGKIRALSNGVENIPIIALTANAFAEDKVLALEAGMNEHITKPIDVDQLKETLSKYI